MPTRLITFLGKGSYETTTYILGEQRQETRFVAHALGRFLKPQEILVFATPEAWDTHGLDLSQKLQAAGLSAPIHMMIGRGKTGKDLWDQFNQLFEALSCDGPVAFDITLGFRAQPFFASAVIQYFQSVQRDSPPLRVYYGAFDDRNKETNETLIWDLTVFVELLRWARAVLLFLRTGRAGDIAEPTERLGKELQKQWAMAGQQGAKPSLAALGKAIQEFGDDFATLRTGALIAEHKSSSQRLLQALQVATDEVNTSLPPLAAVLQNITDLVKPLVGSPRLSKPEGQQALQALAKTYLSMDRYAEATVILREGWITRYAGSQADQPGTESFSKAHREAAEMAWYQYEGHTADKLAQVRNDIGHAGFRPDPKPSKTIKQEVQEIIDRWCALDAVPHLSESSADKQVDDVENAIFYRIGVDQPITPDEPLPPLPDIPRGALVVIEGRAPIWRYGMAFHLLHGSPAGAVAVYDPRLGAVVVATHHLKWKEGQIVDVNP